MLEGDFAGTGDGRPFSVPFAAVMALEGGLVRRSADYFDLGAVLAQLEGAATPATAAAPAA